SAFQHGVGPGELRGLPGRLPGDVKIHRRSLALAGVATMVTLVAGAAPRPHPTPSPPLNSLGVTTDSEQGAFQDSVDQPDCRGRSPSKVSRVDLPWPVTLQTSCGRFTVFQ